jgi:ankyrin repeat protein
MWAAHQGHLGLVTLLLHSGADMEMRDWEHKTAVAIALDSGNYDVVEALYQGYTGCEAASSVSPRRHRSVKGRLHFMKLMLA